MDSLNNNDRGNLRGILSDLCNQDPSKLTKLCPPDYINVFYPLLSNGHRGITTVRECGFRQRTEKCGILYIE